MTGHTARNTGMLRRRGNFPKARSESGLGHNSSGFRNPLQLRFGTRLAPPGPVNGVGSATSKLGRLGALIMVGHNVQGLKDFHIVLSIRFMSLRWCSRIPGVAVFVR